MFEWYKKLVAEAAPTHKEGGRPKLNPDVFSDEFKWKPYRVHERFAYSQFNKHYEIVYIPLHLTGRWKVTQYESGESKLELECKEDILIKNPSYLSGIGGVRIHKYWLGEEEITVRPEPNETINNCGE